MVFALTNIGRYFLPEPYDELCRCFARGELESTCSREWDDEAFPTFDAQDKFTLCLDFGLLSVMVMTVSLSVFSQLDVGLGPKKSFGDYEIQVITKAMATLLALDIGTFYLKAEYSE